MKDIQFCFVLSLLDSKAEVGHGYFFSGIVNISSINWLRSVLREYEDRLDTGCHRPVGITYYKLGLLLKSLVLGNFLVEGK